MIPEGTLSLLREHSKMLLWDTCQLLPAIGTSRVISGAGVLAEVEAEPREYNGSTSIPCRVDIARAFRPGELREQITVIDNYQLELPYDAVIEETDTVLLGGEYYKIRKLVQASAYDLATEVLIFLPGGSDLDRD